MPTTDAPQTAPKLAVEYLDRLVAEQQRLVEIESNRLEQLKLALETVRNAVAHTNGGVSVVGKAERSPLPEPGEPPLSTVEAIRTVLRANRGAWLTARQIADEAQKRGLMRTDLNRPVGTALEAAKRLMGRPGTTVERRDENNTAYFRMPPVEESEEP